jgi:hypothetical protein
MRLPLRLYVRRAEHGDCGISKKYLQRESGETYEPRTGHQRFESGVARAVSSGEGRAATAWTREVTIRRCSSWNSIRHVGYISGYPMDNIQIQITGLVGDLILAKHSRVFRPVTATSMPCC